MIPDSLNIKNWPKGFKIPKITYPTRKLYFDLLNYGYGTAQCTPYKLMKDCKKYIKDYNHYCKH